MYRSLASLGFPDYRVADNGSVWSRRMLKRFKYTENGWGKLSPAIVGKGYQDVTLYDTLGRPHRRYVHRLVLEAFRGACPEGMECRHLNGNKTDNRLANLAWGTWYDNNEDRKRHGTYRTASLKGERNPMAVLSRTKIDQVMLLMSQGYNLKSTAERVGVSWGTVKSLVNGNHWRSVLTDEEVAKLQQFHLRNRYKRQPLLTM